MSYDFSTVSGLLVGSVIAILGMFYGAGTLVSFCLQMLIS